MEKSKTSLLIFTRNEIEGLRFIFDRIPLASVDEVIAIDGHSTDGTVEFLQRKGIRVVLQTRLGRGNAAIEGIGHCSGECVVFLSSDGNEDPADIPKLIEGLREADIAVASRFMEGGRSDDSDDPLRIRKFGNKLVTALINLLWQAHVTDSTNGLRAIRMAAWAKLAIESPYHETEFQMTIRASKLGMKIREIPTTEGKRVGGKRYASTMKMAWTFSKSLLREIWIGNKFVTANSRMKPQVRAHFNAISSFYQRRKRRTYLQMIRKSLGEIPAGRIVDLGCGSGVALSWFEGDKVGVDFSAELLRQGLPESEYVVADIEGVPFRDNSFEAALCLDVAEHLPSLKVIDEAYRILVPNGVFHLSTVDARYGILLEMLEKLRLKLPEGPHTWRRQEEIVAEMKAVGFEYEHHLKPPIRFYRGVKKPLTHNIRR